MFFHNLKYALKTLFKNKDLIFWTFAFPLILATFFNMAFSKITEGEKLDVIPIAMVENGEDEKEVYDKAFNNLTLDNDEKMFDLKYLKEKEAQDFLNEDKIIGYFSLKDNKPTITIKKSGIDETIFKYVIEEIYQTSLIAKDLIESEISTNITNKNPNIDYEKITSNVYQIINDAKGDYEDISKDNIDYVMIEFYTLIAMACMYGGILAMSAINQNLANMSSKGKRVSISPTKKSITIISSLLASYITQLIGLALLYIYTIFALKVDYGNNLLYVILLSCIGSLAGLSLGLFVGSVLKKNENVKTGILISLTMTGSFFAGMFGITMKYIIDKNIPLLNRINPVNMITDGLYSLYYYDTYNRFFLNIISLLIFSIILIIISFISLRRQKYDSI